jgi:DNA replication and repair protein RecF
VTEALPCFRRLRLTQFRNYSSLDWRMEGRLVALAGPNGAGKTNLLEALSFLGPGRGLRRAALPSLARKGGDGGFSILADLEIGPVTHLFATALLPGDAARQSRFDREPIPSAGRFSEFVSFLWLTPDQDGLFRGAAGDRRRFLDRLVLAVDPAHAARAGAYEEALRQRNRLLEAPYPDQAWLDAIEREAAELGVAIAAARRETVTRLQGLIEQDRASIAPFPYAELSLEGAVETELAHGSALQAEDWFRQALRDGRRRDQAAGRALIGPQASDLIVLHGPKAEPAAQCSTGEQKALLIGLVLAQAQLIRQMRGAPPVLLLDEIAAHLDRTRRQALFAILDRLGGQAFLTGTDQSLFEGLPEAANSYEVQAGSVQPLRS